MNKAITAVAALTVLLAMTPSAAAAPPPLFGTAEFRAASLDALPKWQQTLRRIDQEQATYRACARAERSLPLARGGGLAIGGQDAKRSPSD